MNVLTRNDIPLLLNEVGLNGVGVEVGVGEGYYSDIILNNSNLSRLFSIDPWETQPSEIYKDICNVPQFFQNEKYLTAIRQLLRFKTRSVCLRMFSKEASKLFADQSLDFVYLDANHSYDFIKEDLKLWHPKLKNYGLMAGHDYADGNIFIRNDKMIFGKGGSFRVKSAVDEFTSDKNVDLKITSEEPLSLSSWYFFKD